MRPKRQTYRIFYLLVYIFTAFIIHYPAINFKGFKEKFIKFILLALQFPPHMCFSRRGPASRPFRLPTCPDVVFCKGRLKTPVLTPRFLRR